MFVKELDGNDRNQIRYIIHCNKRVMSAYSILIQTDPNKTCTKLHISKGKANKKEGNNASLKVQTKSSAFSSVIKDKEKD